MAIDWDSHRRHRAQVAGDLGQWVGLLDENGEPMFDAPPMMTLSAPRIRNASTSMRATFGVQSRRGVVHDLVDELIAEGLGRVDEQGLLVPVSEPTRFLAIERPGGVRRVYRVSHSVARGQGDAPSEIEVHGNDLLKMLAMFPAMSAPTTWTGEWETFTRDWAGPEDEEILFDQPRDLSGMQMVTVADGATIEGPAEATIQRLIRESLEAAFRVAGVADDPPIVVNPAETGRESPHVLIRPTDKALWDEVIPVAMAAGVAVSARMWWPGDGPVEGMELSAPTVVIDVKQSEEVVPRET